MRQPAAQDQPPKLQPQPAVAVPQPKVAASDPKAPMRYKPEALGPNQRFYFDERKLYPPTGEEYSFEELNLFAWNKKQQELREKLYYDKLERENEELRARLEALSQELNMRPAGSQPPEMTQEPVSPMRRISVVPQSLQPTQGLEYTDMSVYCGLDDAPTGVHEFWKKPVIQDRNVQDKNPFAHDKITLPLDQSQYIRDNVPTSTPTSKNENKKSLNVRRLSRPSVGGGSPTLKLSPITETSRDCNSKSSSSSSAASGTPGTAKKALQPLIAESQAILEEPDRPLDPNDPTTFKKLLVGLVEPIERRAGYHMNNRSLPKIRQGACFQAGDDSYLVDKELSKESQTFYAQLLNDDSNDDSSMDIPIKTFCVRVDQPANAWLFYICNELHRRLVRQKTKPDIELSVMIANPAIFYNDGSILIDEYFRFCTMHQFLQACQETNKPFPKSVAAYVCLELIQVVKQMHNCGIIHMNINPKNIVFTCCPNRDDVANVSERTSIIKLIGFERAMDMKLLPHNFKFEGSLQELITCEMRDQKPWTYEVDWYGTLDCIHQMFFGEEMQVDKTSGKWMISKQIKGFPTSVWTDLFEQLLNIVDFEAAKGVVDHSIDELTAWVKANLSFVLKEAAYLESILEEYCKNNNKSIRT